MTFEQLDLLLRQVSEGMDGTSDWPPPQEKECMVVATLNLLRLQVVHRLQTLCVLLFRVYSLFARVVGFFFFVFNYNCFFCALFSYFCHFPDASLFL